MKKHVILLAMLSILGVSTLSVQASDAVKVTVDGTEVIFTEVSPYIDNNDRVQVPVRDLAESLGCEVEWKEESREVILYKTYKQSDGLLSSDDTYVCMKEMHLFIDNMEYDATNNLCKIGVEFDGTINTLYGADWQGIKTMDTAPVIVNDRTYLPARYIAEYFGYSVEWDDSNNTVIIRGNI